MSWTDEQLIAKVSTSPEHETAWFLEGMTLLQVKLGFLVFGQFSGGVDRAGVQYCGLVVWVLRKR